MRNSMSPDTPPPDTSRLLRSDNKPRLVREKFRGKVFLIPSFITMVALFCGFLAIMSAVKGTFEIACGCIALAIILDGLDGRVARRLNATSAFGREFDSLADLIAFGLAPAILVYFWAFIPTFDDFGIAVSFIYVACAATRLARFNVTATGEVPAKNNSKRAFDGLPSPGGAAAIASAVYFHPVTLSSTLMMMLLLLYTFIIGGLMVSTLPFLSIKHFKLTEGNTRLNVLLLAAAVAITWYNFRSVMLIGTLGYLMTGPLGWFQNKKEVSATNKQLRA